MSDIYRFQCRQCGTLLALRETAPFKHVLHCPACHFEYEFELPTTTTTTALTIQANNRTWGELTREGVPQAFHDAFEREELGP